MSLDTISVQNESLESAAYDRMWVTILKGAEFAILDLQGTGFCETLAFFGVLDFSELVKGVEAVSVCARVQEPLELLRVYFHFTDNMSAPVVFQFPRLPLEPFNICGWEVRAQYFSEGLKILLVDDGKAN